MNDWTDIQLDDAQQSVVDHDGPPLLVLGSAGTGKSTVLLRRWLRLASSGVGAHRILMLVSSRADALRLRQDLPWKLEATALIEAPVHTWHALAYHLVTRYHRHLGYQQAPVLLTASEQFSTVRSLLAREDASAWGDYGQQLDTAVFAAEVADFCIRSGHRCVDDQDLLALASGSEDTAQVIDFAIRYRRHLSSINALDHAGLISSAAGLLAQEPGIASNVAKRFLHVLVDDAQDLAPAQIQLLTHLSSENLVCVGDPDSAVEAFRGADPLWLPRFQEAFPTAESVTLPTSHRHGTKIGEVLSNLISHGPETTNHRSTDFSGPEGTAELHSYPTLAAEVQSVARALKAAHTTREVAYDRMAVIMTQPSVYLAPLKRVLDSLEVPYQSSNEDRNLHEAPAVRWTLTLVRAALSDEPNEQLLASALASPYIGMAVPDVRELQRKAFKDGVPLIDAAREEPAAAEFFKLRDTLNADPLAGADAAFQALFEASGWCRQQTQARHTDRSAAETVEALAALAQAFGHFVERTPGATLTSYLLARDNPEAGVVTWNPTAAPHNGVSLLTPHASRGHEWDLVYVVGVAEGHIPRNQLSQGLFDPWALQSSSPTERALAQLAEERRMLYVAMSRASQELVVSVSPGRNRSVPSRFLGESFGEVPEPHASDVIDQPLTLEELVGTLRRTLSDPVATADEKLAAAAALSRIPGVDPSQWWWRRGYSAGEPLNPDGLLTTSYSRIGNYDNCPLQYVLESVLGLNPSSTYQMKFGSLIHHIFEHGEPGGDIATMEDALAFYKKEFTDSHQFDYPNIVFARTYYRVGAKMIKLWWKTERSTHRTVMVEYSFDDLDVDGHTIRGRIDRVSVGPDGLVLTDYKTAKTPFTKDAAADSLQLAIYWLAAQTYENLSQHGKPAVMQLVYPIKEWKNFNDGSVSCDRRVQTPDQAADAIERLRGILAEAAAEEFNPSPTADCQWCKMRPLCPRWPEGREIPA